MPELPEVETIKRALATRLVGRRIVEAVQHRPDLRIPFPKGLPQRIQERVIEGFGRRAKYILARLDDGEVLLLHLGMSGRLLFDGAPQGTHEHLTLTFDDGTILRLVDPRRFGLIDLVPSASLALHPYLARLGMEPLDDAFTGAALGRLLQRRNTPIKSAIMDQRLVVGVGNIYASEALFRARIRPIRLARDIGPRRASRLASAIQEVLLEAIEAGGSSLRDYVQANGELGNFQAQFKVYGRLGEACPACLRMIERIVQAGRATFYCATCQR